MASRPRRARVVLAVIALAVIGLGVWRGEAVYWWVMTKRIPTGAWESWDMKYEARGYTSRQRWASGKKRWHGPAVHHFVETGLLWNKGSHRDGRWDHGTWWEFDGTVMKQVRHDESGRPEEKTSPPWWWGVTDETAPSMPEWMKDDAKWQAALDAQE